MFVEYFIIQLYTTLKCMHTDINIIIKNKLKPVCAKGIMFAGMCIALLLPVKCYSELSSCLFNPNLNWNVCVCVPKVQKQFPAIKI